MDYNAIKACFITIANTVDTLADSLQRPIRVGFPKIGAGLAGGDWNIIEKIIADNMSPNGEYTLVKFI